MSTVIAIPGSMASTFLTHFFGSGLADDTYVVEWFRATLDGEIRRCNDEVSLTKKDLRKAKYATATQEAVQAMRMLPRMTAATLLEPVVEVVEASETPRLAEQPLADVADLVLGLAFFPRRVRRAPPARRGSARTSPRIGR